MSNTEQKQRRTLRDIIYIASSNLYRHFLGLLTTLFRPSMLGPELYGLWSLLNVLPKYANFAHLGSRTAMRYQIATYECGNLNQMQWRQMVQIKHNALLTAMSVNIVTALCACIYGLMYASSNEATIGWCMFATFILLECLIDHFLSELNGHQKFVTASRVTFFRYTLNFIFTGIFIYFWGFYGAIAALLLAALCSLLYLSFHCRLNFPILIKPRDIVEQIKEGAPIVILDLVNLSLRSIDKLFIAFLLGTQALGYYAVGSMLIGPIMNIPGASRVVTEQSLMSQRGTLSVTQQLDHYLYMPLRLNAYLMPLLIGCGYLVIPVFVELVLPKFQAAIIPTQWLLFSTYFMALSYPCHGLIVANKWQKHAAQYACLALFVSVGLISGSIWLGYHLVGVAISSVIAFLVFAMILILYVLIQFKQSIKQQLLRLFELLLPFAILLILLRAIDSLANNLDFNPIVLSIISILLFIISYLPILYWANKKTRLSRSRTLIW